MSHLIEIELPEVALSARYRENGAFVDCYSVDVPKEISLEKYIQAFYTTPLFKIERTILSLATLKATSDKDAIRLSTNQTRHYSIWTVENRVDNQILLADVTGKTKSWLMVQELKSGKSSITRLYFGSVVVPKGVSKNGQASFGFVFHLLSQFHKTYSRALLNATAKKLLKETT
ncbi:hypothetical protein [Marinomonas algicola]|uniref:hypothetical protein n=1 Tax=Marinomonas algicola TaxID=2773454 RepID=UPI00174A7AF4|nr:hypothetical protein [Marinomonas algicola]